MILLVKGRKIKVKFRYGYAWAVKEGCKKVKYSFIASDVPPSNAIDRRRTVTAILSVEPQDFETPLAVGGDAVCNPRDNFDKEKGRRIALAKALVKLPYLIYVTPEEASTGAAVKKTFKRIRAEFWRKYFRHLKIQSCQAKRRKRPPKGLVVEFIDDAALAREEVERRERLRECLACGACDELEREKRDEAAARKEDSRE